MENIEIATPPQVWQAEIANKIHDTNVEELKSWIAGGKLQPFHNVRVKNLIWVEAEKVPAFQKLFDEKKNGNFTTTNPAPVSFAVAYPELSKSLPSIKLPNSNPKPIPNPNPKKIPTLDELLEEMKHQTDSGEDFDETENDEIVIDDTKDGIHFNCPSCQAECLLETTDTGEQKAVLLTETASKKKRSKIKEIEDFKILTPLDREYKKVGIISAFLMALLFSSSISYFWVYQITLTEDSVVTQNAEQQPSAENPNPASENDMTKQDSSTEQALKTKQAGVTPDGKCIDPETQTPFECSEEMKKVFMEEATKKESVANAQKQVKQKTNLILRLVMPSSWTGESEEAAKEPITYQQIFEEFKNDPNGKRFLMIFGATFLLIFGLLIGSRIISNKKNLPPNNLNQEQTT